MSSRVDSAPIIVLGASGQVGRALVALLKEHGIGLARSEIDLGDLDGLTGRLDHFEASAVINAAAYTQVDQAETEEPLAMRINGEAPGVVARWCAHRRLPFVHFSTDYVFPGTGGRPWTEEDPVSPINTYGRSKLKGEQQVAAAGGRWLIFRTSWVYDASGKNFLTTMLRLAKEREALSVVNDQHGAPTYAAQLAETTLVALERAQALPGFPSGIYHLCNSGETTWHGFAEAIFDAARNKGVALKVKSLKAVPTSEYPTPAKRPANTRLNTDKARRILGVSMPDWRLGLATCMENGS
jgi:dTDP-4-dehydrorhamnose reductase